MPLACAFCQVAPLHRNLAEFDFVGVTNYRRYHAVIHRHREPNVDLGIRANAFASPTCVHARMLLENVRDQRDQ